MSHPTWYPSSPKCKDCPIKCTIEGSSWTKYQPGGTIKPTIAVCPYGRHTDQVGWYQ